MWYGHFDCGDDRKRRGNRGDFGFGDFGFRWEGHKKRGRWGGRMFEQGDLKMVILQLLAEKPLGIVEVQPHRVRERLVAIDDHIPEVAHGYHLPEFQVGAPINQQLQHQLERCPFPLQDA